MNRPKNYRALPFLMGIMLLFSLVLSACSSDNKSTASTTDSGKTAEATAKASPPGSGGAGAGDDKNMSGTVNMWYWDSGFYKPAQEAFNKLYPNIKLNFVQVAAADYVKKVQTSVAAGSELPDIVFGEINARGSLYSLNILDDLTKAPYNFDKSQLMDYVIPQTLNDKGELVSLEWAVSPGGFAYKRNLAKQYFGTDDPDQLSAMFPDWDTFIAKGKEVKEKSSGKVSIIAGLVDAYTTLYPQDATPIIKGTEVNSTEFLTVLKKVQAIRDAGIDQKLDMWSPTWNASYTKDDVIFYPAANWSPKYVIKANDKDSNGRWGIMVPPAGGFSYGGTSLGITKSSKNKDAAWTFLKWYYTTKEGQEVNKTSLDYYVPMKSVFTNSANLSTGADAYFGGQDLGLFWNTKVLPTLKSKPVTKYDNDIYNASTLVAQAMMQDKTFTAEAGLEKWKQELKRNHAELTFK